MLISNSLWGQKGIGTVNPNPSAALDIVSVDKGVLLPRVALTDATSLSPITGTASTSTNGLIIYNTSSSTASGLFGEGYYYWSGGSSGQWTPLKTEGESIYSGSGTVPAGTTATISDTFQFASASSSPTVFFSNAGQVGIQTVTPSATLDVNGEGLMTNLLITDSSSVAGTVSSQSTSTIDDGEWLADSSNNYWYLAKESDNSTTRTASNALVMTDNGRLGIGTTAPTASLHVSGTVRLASLNNGALQSDALGNLSTINAPALTDSQTFSLVAGSTTATETLLTLSTGNTVTLQASGTLSFSSPATDTLVLETPVNDTLEDDDGDTRIALIDTDGVATSSDALVISVAGSETLRIDSSGQVGIQTATPSATLDVNGEGLMTNLLITDSSSVAGTVSSQSTATLDDGEWMANTTNNYWYLAKESDNSTARTAANALVMTDNGRLGIGTTAPTVALDVVGDINATGAITTSSDRRYKIQIENLQNSLSLILQLRGVRHHWKREAFPEKKFPDGPTLGLIAQEVEPLIPELVNTDENGYKSVDYAKLSALLTQALQEQQDMIDAQEERLKQIEKRLGI